MRKRLFICLLALTACAAVVQAQPREQILINDGWTFHLGNASDMEADFGHGTEYFSYLSKIGSNNGNKGPSNPSFDDSRWQKVTLPHDWAVDLPFSRDASHSHGYKCIGWEYPENSVGWYRRRFTIPYTDHGRHIEIRFDGIYRDSQVYCNGMYVGGEKSGYLSSVYDLTPYINYGGENVIAVRADATLEEGWYYEGAGIYRDVYLIKTNPVHIPQFSTRISSNWGRVSVSTRVSNRDFTNDKDRILEVFFRIEDAMGYYIKASDRSILTLPSYSDETVTAEMSLDVPHMWDLDDPYMYRLHTYVYEGDKLLDECVTPFGIRDAEFDPQRGFLLNNRKVMLIGVNLHQDAAGVGTGVPRELWRYRLEKLRSIGVFAIRCSHNPASPALLDLCDEMGFLVIDENRLAGAGQEQVSQLTRMIGRDVNHPSVILWSVGNEEWYVESDSRGYDIMKIMSLAANRADPSRRTIYANAGGNSPLGATDVNGYNYLTQNRITSDHNEHPFWRSICTEETTGCGTRGAMATVPAEGWMLPLNRTGVEPDRNNFSDLNMEKTTSGLVKGVLERGWNFYRNNPYVGGVFFWTGFDYRGEPNPMIWPATGSQFGIFDYCGFPKDEAYYLEVQCTNHTLLHICPVVDGEVWVYSNCDKVTLVADGRNLGSKSMVESYHQSWKVPSGFKRITAKGYKGGRLVSSVVYPDTPATNVITPSKLSMESDGQDIIVLDIDSPQKELQVQVTGPAEILGWGNGNPGFRDRERFPGASSITVKPFNGKVQVLLRSIKGREGEVLVSVPGYKKPLVLNAYGREQPSSSK